jgi:hypothetical protein
VVDINVPNFITIGLIAIATVALVRMLQSTGRIPALV